MHSLSPALLLFVATSAPPNDGGYYPLVVLAIGVAIVLGMILVLRLNAFFALITAAMAVSFLAPGEIETKATRVAEAFGTTTGKIGIAIAMAAVIGEAMTASGAADRIVQGFLRGLGERRAGAAMASSGFVLSIPVFFDTVFYLLCPLARSLYRRTGRHYLKYLLALGAGGTATHSLVPPTPGPLFVAGELGVDLGMMIMVSMIIALPATLAGMLYAGWIDRRLVLSHPPQDDEFAPATAASLPSLGASLAPIVLPIVLIAGHAIVHQYLTREAPPGVAATADAMLNAEDDAGAMPQRNWVQDVEPFLAVAGNANVALMASALMAVCVYVSQRRPSRTELSHLVEQSLTSAGVIILITAAGGAFGAMLKEAQVGEAIRNLIAGESPSSGYELLLLAFGMASLLKTSQGSSTVAMMTAAGMMAATIEGGAALPFHPVYLATAIGSGGICASWMNDSGFWVFCKMGGLTESEGLRSWTPITAIVGLTGLTTTLVLARLLPLV
jgi:GntP family gluconate:H+ symporter